MLAIMLSNDSIPMFAIQALLINLCLSTPLKCHYYAFSNITFHAVCHVAVCEHKLLQSLWRQCTINKVIVYQKRVSSQSPKRVVRNLNLILLQLYVTN